MFIRNIVMVIVFAFIAGCQPFSVVRDANILKAVGYASINDQTGRSVQEKQIKAMRASKMDAYRELAEQVYGMRISGRSDMDGQRLNDEDISAAVDGVIRGAEVIRTYPVGDSYVTELQLDVQKMELLRDYGEVQHVPAKRQQTLF